LILRQAQDKFYQARSQPGFDESNPYNTQMNNSV